MPALGSESKERDNWEQLSLFSILIQKERGIFMRITVLCDNNTRIDSYYLGEPGVSFYIEDGDARILMDTGYSDVYVKNAGKMGVDLTQLTALVLSHGHNDHTGGLDFLPDFSGELPLYAHPQVFAPKRYEGESIGMSLTKEEAAKRFNLHLSRQPVRLSRHITFLGEIPRGNNFEAQRPIGERLTPEGWVPDFLPDDTALVYHGEEGLTIITGCSHSGIINITEYAKEVCGDDRICGIVGGFHLLSHRVNSQVQRTVDYLAKLRPSNLRPCHCTCFYARAAIHARTPIWDTCAGDVIEV